MDNISDEKIIAVQIDLPMNSTPEGFICFLQVDSPTDLDGFTIIQVDIPTSSAPDEGSTAVQIDNSADGYGTAVRTEVSAGYAQDEIISVRSASPSSTASDSCIAMR